jgi:hypothetical protein
MIQIKRVAYTYNSLLDEYFLDVTIFKDGITELDLHKTFTSKDEFMQEILDVIPVLEDLQWKLERTSWRCQMARWRSSPVKRNEITLKKWQQPTAMVGRVRKGRGNRMALKETIKGNLKIGPVTEGGYGTDRPLPPNPAETLRTGPLNHRTFPTDCGCKPFERREVVNLYRRNEPSPEDYCEPRPEDEGSVGKDKFGPQMKPPKAQEITSEGQPIRGTC